jgi:hypothetical protein
MESNQGKILRRDITLLCYWSFSLSTIVRTMYQQARRSIEASRLYRMHDEMNALGGFGALLLWIAC